MLFLSVNTGLILTRVVLVVSQVNTGLILTRVVLVVSQVNTGLILTRVALVTPSKFTVTSQLERAASTQTRSQKE